MNKIKCFLLGYARKVECFLLGHKWQLDAFSICLRCGKQYDSTLKQRIKNYLLRKIIFG